jgi:hypothetical protein
VKNWLKAYLLVAEMVGVCAWCKRIKKPDGTFAYEEPPAGATLTHGICPECREKLRQEMKNSSFRASYSYLEKLPEL